MGSEDLPLEALEVADRDKTAVHPVALFDAVEAETRRAALICTNGRSVGQMFLLSKTETILGRAQECDVFLDDEGVSRHHAKVVRSGDTLVLVDLGSTNGTYHNGERVQVLTLRENDRIQIGTATVLQFRYQDEQDLQFFERLRSIQNHDALTKAYNRRAFDAELEKEAAYARRHNEALALIMFDLDHFKRINDTYGHQAGDMVLERVSECIRGMMRKEEFFARYGGEEFAILVRNTDEEKVFLFSERIRRAVEKLEITHQGQRIPCTISVGIALLSGGASFSLESFIHQADSRLYEAKRKGRNRTECGLFDG